ncbi:MAG: hypothetical protein EAY66_03020 [Sphingobacteriales bacterium]|nr:MAG: hypothetical protein EAY66_03020 [Sphingobacteriales bacterium]
MLPKHFTAKTVEVIIMPFLKHNPVPEWQKNIVLQRMQNPETEVDAFEMIEQLEAENIEKL